MGIIERALEKKAQQQNKSVSGEQPVNEGVAIDPLLQKQQSPADQALPTISSEDQQPVAETDRELEQQAVQIDMDRLRDKGMLVPDLERNRIKEEYRVIKRRLLNTAFNVAGPLADNANLVMVTSANPSEGKSFNAINLAMSIAHEQDRTVLLVDADVVKPSLTKELGIEPRPGLVDYLLGKVEDIGDVICNTNIPRLKIIQAGQSHHLTSELLASDKMRALVSELGARYPDRLVLFDSPPLLGVTEAHAMAQLAGQTVLVVSQGRTLKKDVQACVPLLNPDSAVGLLMNRAKPKDKKYYAYGYYNG
ncbi:exopolysaccharide biosynthesis protein [Corallincola holothuriorum]|uniref:non-specific protein-tyrosine kinase n=1 Tax=Corallincola holothuriorum TaxID=2282215 RepID=A0A368N6G7_9GAMM|nr:XrtA-associated tyrosine autokinase [Corallincola holothuriorum]RCU45144.1 exopolysaccharide biosynthesis protein [Corallincola holothuriorum]